MLASDPVQQRERRKVERAAKTIAGGEARARRARSSASPSPRLLRRLYAQKATGSLLLLRDATKDATKKIVAFEGGYPVSVKSNVLAECLGQILVSRKLITEAALTESVARMKTEKRQQGQILVEMGALSPYNLQRALVEQVETKLLEVFAWPDGKFMFKESETTSGPGSTLRLERPPAALVFEGIRRHYDEARQRAVLDGYVRRPSSSTPTPCSASRTSRRIRPSSPTSTASTARRADRQILRARRIAQARRASCWSRSPRPA